MRPILMTLITVLLLAPAVNAQTCDPTPEQLIFDEMSFIAGLDIPNGIETMLYIELHAALDEFANEDIDATVGELENFIAKVTTQSGKQLAPEDADLMIALGEEIIVLLTKPPFDCLCYGYDPLWEAFLSGAEPILSCTRPISVVLRADGSSSWISVNTRFNTCRSSSGMMVMLPNAEELQKCMTEMREAAAAHGVSCPP